MFENKQCYRIHYLELWSIIAEILTKYIVDHKKIDEGDKNGHNFKTVKSVLLFPFQYTNLEKSEQVYIILHREIYFLIVY